MKLSRSGALFGAAAVLLSSVAPAVAQPMVDNAVYRGDAISAAKLDKVQFIYGGRNYCWYAGGWHGPGWYWCGYAYRRGLGWGGIEGWHGWRHGGPGWHGGPRGGWHGGPRGDWHGGHGGHGHGDWHH